MTETRRSGGSGFPSSIVGCFVRIALVLSFTFLLLPAVPSWAGVGGTVSGTVKDASNAVFPNVTVKATNIDTGVQQQVVTNDRGFYSFPDLSIGRYDITVERTGFKPYRRAGIAINADSALIVDAILQIGEQTQAVTVNENAVHVETSDTQMGEVITGEKMAAVPLNGRSYTDLLALQPGVVPATSLTSNTQQDIGVSALSPSGSLNPGTISINGQREFSNGFIVNGSDVEEDVNSGTSVIPNLDSIAEFRILTSNFDAEYGGHSGGQINVITKSGTNQFHGDAFEFLRNTSLDAKNYFSPTRGEFDQNQFGGTLGGPIVKNKLFFFADYQGTRLTQGVDTGQIPVPSSQDRSGNLLDQAGAGAFQTTDASGNTVPTTVSGPYWATQLSQKLGYQVSAGEPYYTPGCGATTCVFPGALIPQSVWSAPAKNLLQYIPAPNNPNGTFSTSAQNETLQDDKGAYRLDYNTHWGMFSAYYFQDAFTLDNPYPVAQSGASVPGFNALYFGRAQLISLGHSKTFGTDSINEFHFSYVRNNNDLGKPVGGLGVSLASQGFVTGAGTAGIVPLNPKGEGVENIVFNSFSIGTNANELKQANNTFQWVDNFSKVVGRHTMRFGAEFHYDQINTDAVAQFNGNFIFTGSETGSDFADFLLGVPSVYNQSQLQPFYGRNKYAAVYAQDSWRVRSNLTLNYGLRWDRIEPWYEKNNGISTFEPGKDSVVFPGAPPGFLFPGDPGVPKTLAPAGNLDFAPRVAVAYSPGLSDDSILGKMFGGSGKTSIRAGFGIEYTSIEALSIGILAANPPFGVTYSSPAPPLFATPFITASNGQDQGQPFPETLATGKITASNPDANVNWPQYEPITGIPAYAASNRIPYVRQFTVSYEREIGTKTVLSASYVGEQGRRLLVLEEANPGDPALCLSLSDPSQVAPDSATCGPFAESSVFTTAAGQVVDGTRGPLGANFGSNTYQTTIGKSNFNALEVSLHHQSGPLEFSAGYTYGKSMDDSSNLGEEVNPITPSLSYALSAFDIRHNFVVSYNYHIPLQRLLRRSNRWTEGWDLSGITHFSSGLPVTLTTNGDNSLLGTDDNGINNATVDEPNYSGGALSLNHNPRNGLSYFNTDQFSENALGTQGNASRRFFAGPGTNNFDMALGKTVHLSESRSLQLRLEAFNVFNHAQFFGPQTVDGNFSSSTFGQVINADPPRLVQLGVKFLF